MIHRILFLVTFLVAGAVSADAPQGEPLGFAQVLPSAIKWVPSPVVPGTYRAVLLGNPDEAGPFVVAGGPMAKQRRDAALFRKLLGDGAALHSCQAADDS